MKLLWTYIKQKKADDNIIPESDGALHQDSVDKADILNKQKITRLNKQFQMAFSSKSEITTEIFKSSCNMRGDFETMPEINITEQA